ncbi:MAG: NAD-dependent epimerase/dehydratase family protein [Bacteriovorax sp.]
MTKEEMAQALKGKSLLITGGSGFFGKNLCEALNRLNKDESLGMTIYALARNPVHFEGIKFLQHDITAPLPFDLKMDYIIHAATPVTGPASGFDQTMDIIVNGTKHALDFAEKCECSKFLLISSGAVYGEQPQSLLKIPEDHAIKGSFFDFKSAYGTGKRISELLALDWARKSGIHLNIARCFAFSGRHLPIDQHLAIGNFIRDAIYGNAINVQGDGSAVRSYMDADDLVTWLLTILLRAPKNEIYNVGSDQEISIKDLAMKISGHVFGVSVSIQGAPEGSGKRSRYVPSIEKAKSDLGLKINISLDESIQRMIEFNMGKK